MFSLEINHNIPKSAKSSVGFVWLAVASFLLNGADKSAKTGGTSFLLILVFTTFGWMPILFQPPIKLAPGALLLSDVANGSKNRSFDFFGSFIKFVVGVEKVAKSLLLPKIPHVILWCITVSWMYQLPEDVFILEFGVEKFLKLLSPMEQEVKSPKLSVLVSAKPPNKSKLELGVRLNVSWVGAVAPPKFRRSTASSIVFVSAGYIFL